MEDYTSQARRELETRGLLSRFEGSEILYLALTGSHSFGFPSQDSDLDIRGVSIPPTESMLGFKDRRRETHQEISEDRMIDLVLEEIDKYVRFLAQGRGDRIEWLTCPTIHEGKDFSKFREEALGASLSQKLWNHYFHFSQSLAKGGKTGERTVKTDLYALRSLLTGIHLMETRELDRNILRLNENFNIEILNRMIKDKRQLENGNPQTYDREELDRNILPRLYQRLEMSSKHTGLPESPDTDKLDKLLIDLKLQHIRRQNDYS